MWVLAGLVLALDTVVDPSTCLRLMVCFQCIAVEFWGGCISMGLEHLPWKGCIILDGAFWIMDSFGVGFGCIRFHLPP